MSQKPNSDNLSETPEPNEGNILSEYQNMAGKEARESPSISNHSDQLGNVAKADEIDKTKEAIDQTIESAQKEYSNPGGAFNPDANVYPVLKVSYEAMRDDLKNYGGKVKPGKETKTSNGDTPQEPTARLLAHVNAFGIRIELLKRNTFLGVLLVTIIVAAVAVGGLGLLNPKAESTSPGSVEANQPNNNPLELVLITPSNPVCSISFSNPIAELPNFGPVLFEWNNVPEANSYSLKVVPPVEAGLPWVYSANDNSKKIYMENFPMGGTFLISVNALSESEEILCTATLGFDKTAFVKTDKENEENNSESENAPCVTTGIAYVCP